MKRWENKVAVVTGASAGIGEATVKSLAENGMLVVALARSEDKLKDLASTNKGKIIPMKCDVKNEQEIIEVFRSIEQKFGGVDVLVNNAAYFHKSELIDGSATIWKDTLDTNVLGYCICSKEALKSMRKRGDNGHIININSIVGHQIRQDLQHSLGMYPPSKFAITGLTENLRKELRMIKSAIKVTSLSPGLVHTHMGNEGAYLVYKIEKEDNFHKTPFGFLASQDIADAVVSVLSFQPDVEIQELTLQSSFASREN